MRQTNHNSRYNPKTGKVYSRKHNDRQYDVTQADNINEKLVSQNIIIHYDIQNNPIIINFADASAPTIDAHEHYIYEQLFEKSLSAQNKRNDLARHSERNKFIDDLLNSKNTCPEENIFQIGSLEDGYPDEKTLLEIYNEYHQALLERLGNNIHFLDAALHLDEAVPHIHERRIYTYIGKDGLAISQNKALEEMGFERPDLTKSPSKYNNSKISFSEWERNLKIELCKKHGLEIEENPLVPGKSSLTKDEAIGLKLQKQNQELREETEQLLSDRDKLIDQKDAEIEKKTHKILKLENKLEKISAQLISEKEKNKSVSDTNIFGQPNKIVLTPHEFRSYQLSAETKEANDKRQQELDSLEKECSLRKNDLDKRELALDFREQAMDFEIEERINEGIQERLPQKIREWQEYIPRKEQELTDYEHTLSAMHTEQEQREQLLKGWERNLKIRQQNMDEEIRKSVVEIIRNKFKEFFNSLARPLIQHFTARHQQQVLNVINDMPLNNDTMEKLSQMGYSIKRNETVQSALIKAECKDIREALHASGVSYCDIDAEDVIAVRQALNNGKDLDSTITRVANNIAREYMER